MTVEQFAEVVRKALHQYDEGAIFASELHNHLLLKACEVESVSLTCPQCGKVFGDVAPVICDACGADTLGDLS